MTSRRKFIQQSSFLSAALFMNPSNLLLNNKKKVGIQLYTMRDFIFKNPKEVLKKIAAIGFKEVETFGYGDGKQFGLTVKEFAALLNELGLNSPSGHYGVKNFLFEENNYDEVKEWIDVAKSLGQKYIVVPYLEEHRRKTLDDYKKMAPKMNKAGELCKNASLQLAYHNHDFEFTDLGGGNGYDILIKETDSHLVKMELDLFWVNFAGKNPVDIFKSNPGRFKMWHVKDRSKQNPKKNTEIGTGSIDFISIVKEATLSGVEHYYLEQENFDMDAYESLSKSFDYMKHTMLKR